MTPKQISHKISNFQLCNSCFLLRFLPKKHNSSAQCSSCSRLYNWSSLNNKPKIKILYHPKKFLTSIQCKTCFKLLTQYRTTKYLTPKILTAKISFPIFKISQQCKCSFKPKTTIIQTNLWNQLFRILVISILCRICSTQLASLALHRTNKIQTPIPLEP